MWMLISTLSCMITALLCSMKPMPPHVSGEIVHLLDSLCRQQAVLPSSQIEGHELVGGCLLILSVLQIHTTHPGFMALEELREVMANEASSSGYQDAPHVPSPRQEA